MFFPKKIVHNGMDRILRIISPEVKDAMSDLMDTGFSFYAVDQRRGICYYNDRVITIPMFVLKHPDRKNYVNWYVSHECAHAFNFIHSMGKPDGHGPAFMAELKKICPPASLHFETGYKPRNAKAAGISNIPFFNTGVIPSDF